MATTCSPTVTCDESPSLTGVKLRRLARVDPEQRDVGGLVGPDDGRRDLDAVLPSLLKTTVTELAVTPLSLTT